MFLSFMSSSLALTERHHFEDRIQPRYASNMLAVLKAYFSLADQIPESLRLPRHTANPGLEDALWFGV